MSAMAMPPSLLSQHLGAVLSAALEPPGPPGGAAAKDLCERVSDFMRQQLDQPGLAAQDAAQQVGVSLRTLHRNFAAQGMTFAGTLRRLRLERAVQLLVQPQLARLTVAEVGRRCGFADTSHFVREFRRAWGSSPARWRRGRGDV